MYIQAVGRRCSSDIWFAAATEARHNVLVETVNEWLPKLSEWLRYSHKAYPVLVHGVPTSFNTSHDGKNVNNNLINYNLDIITCLKALQSAKFLGDNRRQMPRKAHGSLILNFTDPFIVNVCIDHHVMLRLSMGTYL